MKFKEYLVEKGLLESEKIDSCGFALYMADEDIVNQYSEEDGVKVDWDILNKDMMIVERNILSLLKKTFSARVRDEGHSDGSLVGSIMGIEKNQDIIEEGESEPITSSSGKFSDYWRDKDVFKRTSGKYDEYIMPSIEFFDIEYVKYVK